MIVDDLIKQLTALGQSDPSKTAAANVAMGVLSSYSHGSEVGGDTDIDSLLAGVTCAYDDPEAPKVLILTKVG